MFGVLLVFVIGVFNVVLGFAVAIYFGHGPRWHDMDDVYAFLFRNNRFGRATMAILFRNNRFGRATMAIDQPMAIDQSLESAAGGDDNLSDFEYS